MVAPYSGAMLPMVARSGSDMESRPGPIELDELVDDALLAQHLRDREHEVGGGDALAEAAVQLETDDVRQEHIHGLTEHDGFGLDAAHAPPHDAQAVDHGGVRVGADERIGEGDELGRPDSDVAGRASTTCARYSRLTWCTMPVMGGTTRKLLKAFWPHLRNS